MKYRFPQVISIVLSVSNSRLRTPASTYNPKKKGMVELEVAIIIQESEFSGSCFIQWSN
jgi:hypothetical protein